MQSSVKMTAKNGPGCWLSLAAGYGRGAHKPQATTNEAITTRDEATWNHEAGAQGRNAPFRVPLHSGASCFEIAHASMLPCVRYEASGVESNTKQLQAPNLGASGRRQSCEFQKRTKEACQTSDSAANDTTQHSCLEMKLDTAAASYSSHRNLLSVVRFAPLCIQRSSTGSSTLGPQLMARYQPETTSTFS